ncbi:MAG: hypothetical protein ACK5IQ_03130 [Bacteroidales bacterium]
MRAYKRYPSRVLLMLIQDQDSSDCKELKETLVNLVRNESSEIPLIVRISCRELEKSC